MENRIIKISEKILGLIVPSDAHKLFIDNGMQYLIYDVPNYKNWVKDDVLLDYNKLQKFLSSAKEGEDWKRGGKKLPDGNWKIHGICTLPSLEFDFEVDGEWISESGIDKGIYLDYSCGLYRLSKEASFRTRIQKAIQDEGLLIVNPYENPLKNSDNGFYGFNKRTGDKLQQYFESESKVIRGKLLIIEKI